MKRSWMTTTAVLVAIACPQERSDVLVATPATPPPARECGGCHEAEVTEWDSSLHHRAFSDTDFQASFAVEPSKFCFDCHAPQATGRGDTVGEAKGIGCKSCHASETGHGATMTDCATCHEFAFPHRGELMQSTMQEHAASEFRETECSSCHMPRAHDGHRNHRFDVSRNPAFLKRALTMKAARTRDGVQIELTPRNVGHRFPTGDLFRRVLVVVRSEAADGAPLGEEEVLIGRRFEHGRGFTREIADTRLAGPQTFIVRGDWLATGTQITVTARYERVSQTTEIHDARGGWQRRDAIFGATVLDEVVLSATAPAR